MMISIVVPIFNEEENIKPLSELLIKILANKINQDYEIIFVDDGSSDGTWELIKNLARANNKIRGLLLSRNFGHQYALKAGLDFSSGDAVISMDGDLQHPPNLSLIFFRSGNRVIKLSRLLEKKPREAEFLKT